MTTVHIDDHRRDYSPQLIRPTKVSKLRGTNIWGKMLYPPISQPLSEKIAVLEKAKAECKQLMAVEKDNPLEFGLLQEDYKFVKSLLYLCREKEKYHETETR